MKRWLIFGLLAIVIFIGIIIFISNKNSNENISNNFSDNKIIPSHENAYIFNQSNPQEQKEIGRPIPGDVLIEITPTPSVDLQARIISLTLEDEEGYMEGSEIIRMPKDTALIYIEKILDSQGDYDWNKKGITEKAEIEVRFRYSARPVRIWEVEPEVTYYGDSPDSIVSAKNIPPTYGYEDGFFIHGYNGNESQEVVLLGLEKGSEFKTRIWRDSFDEIKIDYYERI